MPFSDGPSINKEVMNLTNEFCLKSGYHLDKHTSSRPIKPGMNKFPIVIKKTKQPSTDVGIRRLFYTQSISGHTLVEDFFKAFKKEIVQNWDYFSIHNLFVATKGKYVKERILTDFDVCMKYLTLSLDKINSKNLKKYSNLIKNKDEFHLFVEKLRVHPNWCGKEDEIKKFLLENGYQKAYHEVFNQGAQDIHEIAQQQVMAYSIDFDLLPGYSHGNVKPHSKTAIHVCLTEMVNRFNELKPQDCPIKHIAYNNGLSKMKLIHFIHEDPLYAQIFSKNFFDFFRKQLKDNEEFRFWNISIPEIATFMKNTDIAYQHDLLENTLSKKATSKKNIKI